MFYRKDKGLATSAIVVILLLCGVVVSTFSYGVGLNAADSGIDGSYTAYEEITGEDMKRPDTAPVGAYPIPEDGVSFSDYFFDNFVYENGTTGELAKNTTAEAIVKQTKKKANAYEVTLKFESPADLSTIGVDPDIAMVVVMDISGSMQYDFNSGGWCNSPSCSSYKKYSTSHKWQHRWAIDPATGENLSRFRYAAEAMEDFLNSYASGDDGRHMLSVVYFGTNASKKQGWVNVNEAAGLQTAKSSLSYNSITANPQAYTMQGSGLEIARTLLKEDSVKDIPYKYVLLITDGKPTGTPSGVSNSMNTSGKHATQVASLIESECNATVQCIAFNTSGETLSTGKYVNDWLRDDVATTPEDYYSAENATELKNGLTQLYQKVADEVSLFVMQVNLNNYIDLNGVTSNTSAFEVADNQIKWKLREDMASKIYKPDGTVKYLYEFTFVVSLDTDEPGFQYGKYCPIADEISMPVIDLNPDGTTVVGAEVERKNIPSPQIYPAKSPN